MAKDSKLSALEKAIQAAVGADRVLGLDSDPAKLSFPALWEWLSRVYVGRDHVKQPAVLTVRLGPEGCLVTLTDRDLSCSFETSCPHLGDCLAAMERALNAPAPPMRSWGKKEPQLRKRKAGG